LDPSGEGSIKTSRVNNPIFGGGNQMGEKRSWDLSVDSHFFSKKERMRVYREVYKKLLRIG
jgi:hypothetical protein